MFGWAHGRALVELLIRLAKPLPQCVVATVFACIFDGCIDFLQERAHDERLSIDWGQHDGNVHDLLLGLLPAVAAGDNGKRLERVVPTTLAELDVFEVEIDEGAAVCFDEMRYLG